MDVTLKARRDGVFWFEDHWMEITSLDSPEPVRNVVAIEDGTGEMAPMFSFVERDRMMP